MKLVYFNRSLAAGYSINKVTQTIISNIPDKEEYYVPCVGTSICSIIKNIFYVWRNRNKNAINHITGDIHYCIMALVGCKSVLTIHDTVSLDFNQLSGFKRLIVEWLWFRIPLKLATKVVCISEATRHCVQKYTSRADIIVIHNALDPIFEEATRDQPSCHEAKTVLLIGTNPNKNVIRTIEATAGLNCRFVIIGELNQEQLIALSKHHINYVNKVGLTDAQIVEEYRKCDIVSFVSLFEGFGMIAIEANKVGRPVICSNIPALREVAGDAALYVEPLDVQDIRRGFIRLLSEPDLCQNLVKNGEKNVCRFEASSIRQQWMKLYETI